MARFNLLCMFGFIVSAVSIVVFWFWMWIGMYGFGSMETDLDTYLKALQGGLAVLFMIGTLLSLFSPLAGLLQVPGVVVFPIIFWYEGSLDLSHAGVIGLCSVGLIGCALTVSSIFVQVFRETEPEQLIPWYRTWRTTREDAEKRGRPKTIQAKIHRPAIPRNMLLALIASTLLVLAGFTTYTLTQPVSTLRVEALFNISEYGDELDVALYVDHRFVSSSHLTSGDFALYFVAETDLDPGKHDIAFDFANASTTLDGVWEYSTEVRVLPYTLEYQLIGFGVAFI